MSNLDAEARAAISECSGVAVAWWLMASYLYYHCDVSILSDAYFDDLSEWLDRSWGDIDHFHKHLIDREALSAGTAFYLREDDYPLRTRRAAEALIPKLKGTAPMTVTDQSPPAAQPENAIDNAIHVYRNLRDERAALKKEFDEIDKGLKQRMESLEVALLKKMDSIGVTQLKSGAGLAYVETTHKPTCGDWDAFYDWVLTTGRFDCLQKRLATTTINDIVDETGELPPGCSMVSERVVNIRKA